MYERRIGRVSDVLRDVDTAVSFGEDPAGAAESYPEDDGKQSAWCNPSGGAQRLWQCSRADDTAESGKCCDGGCAGCSGHHHVAAVLQLNWKTGKVKPARVSRAGFGYCGYI